MPFPRRVYDPPPATNEEIAIVLRKLQVWRKELKGLLINSITPHNTPTELIAHILGFVGFDPPQELSEEERRLTLTECRDPTPARLIYVCIYVYLQPG